MSDGWAIAVFLTPSTQRSMGGMMAEDAGVSIRMLETLAQVGRCVTQDGRRRGRPRASRHGPSRSAVARIAGMRSRGLDALSHAA
jgi:hypothetical protein